MRTPARLLLAGALVLAGHHRLEAACNLIPSATETFRSTLGATNKPFAAPGDFVEVSVRRRRGEQPAAPAGRRRAIHPT